jgi:hypothetical protein
MGRRIATLVRGLGRHRLGRRFATERRIAAEATLAPSVASVFLTRRAQRFQSQIWQLSLLGTAQVESSEFAKSEQKRPRHVQQTNGI